MPTIGHMTIQRMDHVGIVVDDLADAVAFFVELGLELQGEAPVDLRLVEADANSPSLPIPGH